MRKSLITLIAFTFLIVKLDAQVVDFESINFDVSGVWNGADLSGAFVESGFEFYNSFIQNGLLGVGFPFRVKWMK